MKKIQSLTFYKDPRFILTLILAVFFLKGVFLAVAYPIFTGQDETRHYNTIQYMSEPENKTWDINILSDEERAAQDKDNLGTYRFSEEIKNTAIAVDNDILRSDMFNTIVFSDSYDGINETEINSKLWEPINYDYPPDITGRNGQNLYHQLGTFIEKMFADENILIRFYLIRIFSVLLGTLTVFFSYLIIRETGFQPKYGLLMTAIIAFQPKFSSYVTNINYAPLLFLFFATFTLGGILYLKKGLDWKNMSLMVISVFLGMRTKGTAIVLAAMLIFLLAFMIYKKISAKNNKIKHLPVLLFFLASSLILFFFQKYLPLVYVSGISEIFSSLGNYLKESLTIGKMALSARTYWGTLSWVDNRFLENATDFIWIVQAFAIIGLGLLFFSKKPYPDFLPDKKYVVFLIVMIAALQAGVRLADWMYFAKSGNLELGAPGRYFLPNLAAHIILVFTGLGLLFERFFPGKGERYFNYSLILSLILMFAFTTYLIFDVIIFRFYL